MTEPSDGKNEISPLVSIITPTYNSDREYLFEAIASVLQQTYPKIEYIITDDGSEHFPEEEVKEFLRVNAGKNIISWTILRHETNIGTVKNVNGALRVAKGKYIFGLAHDDIYYDEKVIEEWVEEFQKTHAKVMTALRMIHNDSETTEARDTFPTKKQINKIIKLSQKKLYFELIRGNFIFGASTAYSTDCFKKHGLYNEKYILLEDWPYYLTLLTENERIFFWKRIVIKYRLNGVSTQRITNKKLLKDDILCRSENIHRIKQEMSFNHIKIPKYTPILIYLIFLNKIDYTAIKICNPLDPTANIYSKIDFYLNRWIYRSYTITRREMENCLEFLREKRI